MQRLIARRSTSAAYMKYNQNPMLMRLSTKTSQWLHIKIVNLLQKEEVFTAGCFKG